MDLPKLDLSILPDLEVLTGVFGSLMAERGHNDAIIVLATYIYEVMPPGG